MQKIIEWLNENSKNDYSNFKLLEIEYEKSINKTTFKFHYLGETFIDKTKDDLKNLLSEYLQYSTDVNIKLKPYFIDCRVLKTLVSEYLKQFYNGVYVLFDENNIVVNEIDEKKYEITLLCDNAQFTYLEDKQFEKDINSYFAEVLFDEISCKLEQQKVENNEQKIVESKYKVVSPEEYILFSQSNLFDTKVQVNDYLKNNTFVVFDLETTGLFYNEDEITEIGAVKIIDGRIAQTFTTLLKPSKKISEEITKITGITNEMVADAPTFENVVGDFYEFCKGSILVGYNILEFDIKFLNFHAQKYGYNFSNKIDDALLMARKYLLGLKRYKLKDVSNHLGVVLDNAHRALFDTIATAEVFIKLTDFMEK